MKNKLLVIGIVSIGLVVTGCSSKKASAPASRSKSDDCTSKVSSGKTSTSKTSSKAELTSYGLAASNYGDIKDIIDDQCVSCHVAGGVGGVDLSTYKTLKANASKVIDTINADNDTVMPPGGKMKSSNIDKIQLWVDDGKKDESGTSSNDEDTEEDPAKPKTTTKPTTNEKSTSSDCETSSGSSSDEDDIETDGDEASGASTDDGGDSPVKDVKKDDIDPKLFDMYIEPLELKNCYAEGHPYLRTGTKTPDDPTPRCDTGVNHPAKFTCDKAGVLAAFNNDETVTVNVEALVSEGYLFDQCGEAGGKPVVYFVCFSGEDGKCVAKDKLVGGSLTISTSYINRP